LLTRVDFGIPEYFQYITKVCDAHIAALLLWFEYCLNGARKKQYIQKKYAGGYQTGSVG
jgi:hypothetical protein